MGTKRTLALCGALLGALLASPARADRAVVVGVQRYTYLPAGANSLQGCLNDARAMKTALERYRFTVTLLANEQATKQGILDALQKQKTLLRPNERFVFFFAGHGTDTPRPSLLPSDARVENGANHLTRDELYNAVVALPARSRTILLDSCFSGGMARSLDRYRLNRPTLRARYYPTLPLPPGQARSPVPVNRQDANQGVAGGAQVCYYVASLGNEKAMEESFGGTHHGVFTYFLVSQLDGKQELWKTIHTAVKGKVVDYLFDWQHPTLSPAPYLQAPVFEAEGKPKPPPPPVPSTVWDTYNTDYPDAARVSLRMEPDKTTVVIGEDAFRFTARVGMSGYLVILERDVEGKIYRLFPKSGRLEDAKVTAGQTVRIPEDRSKAYSPDAPGTEHLKAILFTNPKRAGALLGALPKGAEGVTLEGAKRLQEVPAQEAPFYTSEIAFEVDGKPAAADPARADGAL